MDQDNYTEISLVDLFAFFVKKFWVLLIGALVGMVLLLSFHYISQNSVKNIEIYEKSVSKYKAELSSLESILANTNLKLDFANEVESVSPIFSDNQVYVSRIIITVDSDIIVQPTDSESGNNPVGQEIKGFWNNLDLSSTVGPDMESDVIRASILFEQAGQSASIRVYGLDRNKTEKDAERIVNAFVSYFDAREHLSVGTKTITTSIASKNEIALIRDQFVADKADLLTIRFDKEAEIKSLKKSAPSKYHLLKNAVIGFLVGGILVAIVLVIVFVSSNPVTCSFSVEKALSIPFLGALFIDNCLLSKLARKIMMERSFRNHDDSLAFLRSSFATKFFTDASSKKSIILMSSVYDAAVEKTANEIKEKLKDNGYDVSFVGNSCENPLTVKALEDSESVILLERQWHSRMLLTRKNKNLASMMNKEILGFIIC